MRLIDADALKYHQVFKEDWLGKKGKYSNAIFEDEVEAQPTIDAVPVSFIQQRIDHLQDVADYAFDSIGGYIESANSSLYELKLLLSSWKAEQEKQNDNN